MHSFSALAPIPNVKAGGTVNVGDIVEQDVSGLGWGAETPQTSDYITTGPQGQIVAQTSISTSAPTALTRNAVLYAPDRTIYVVGNAGSASGVQILRFTPQLGAQPYQTNVLLVGAAGGGSVYTPRLHLLNNDTMVAVWLESAAATLCFGIVDINLNIVVGRTVIDTGVTGHDLSSISFNQPGLGVSGPGFAVCYTEGSAPGTVKYASYNNAGTAVIAPTAIQTWGNVGSNPAVRMALLSSGNIAFATLSNSNIAGSLGVWVGVLNPALGIISAIANTLITTASAITAIPDVVALSSGFFAVACGISTTWTVGVFNNLGAQQGASFTTSTANTTTLAKKLMQDGTNFYFLFGPSASSAIDLAVIPVTGTNYIILELITTGAGTYTFDAFIERDMIVVSTTPSAAQNQYIVVRLKNFSGTLIPELLTTATNYGGSSGTASLYPTIIPGGDFTFCAIYDYSTTLYGVIFKYSASAILGVALGSGVAGSTIPVIQAPGTYGINYIGGTSSIVFDMTTATAPAPLGHKGAVANNSMTITA